MVISLELVPNNEELLSQQLSYVKSNFPNIEGINIPDLLKFEMRSWEGCRIAKGYYQRTIPHIRAMDIDLEEPLPMAKSLIENNICEVLILTGDLPQDMNRKIYHSSTIDVIRKFKTELPHIKVYGAIDQYRDSFKTEMLYVKRKIYAGVDGFFTQPFFDMRLLSIYEEMLSGTNVFFGISPVLSEHSQNYWHAKNNVIFPEGFSPNYDWNIDFAKKATEFADSKNRNLYFMPIKTSLEQYLHSVFR
ncbi:MAG: 5,10-methylenetetrahydrofolate reductase [Firmicutes bacterium HGW-Firmicutes-1]|jgi:methylenetetrahydrofolate reductase (NADPH)|nr:MAG: 5,10-methylenetetrahydrofolate reductase [Firmicutes bacterium HGW-Firmicutes-1]